MQESGGGGMEQQREGKSSAANIDDAHSRWHRAWAQNHLGDRLLLPSGRSRAGSRAGQLREGYTRQETLENLSVCFFH